MKTAIITGGTRGIGEAVARRLAQSGVNVVVWGTNAATAAATAEKIASECGVKTLGAAVDVADKDAVGAAVEAAAREFGAIDILVNNAGITRDGLLLTMKDDDWDAVIDTNLKGVFVCTRALARLMAKQRRGVIVNIASVVGIIGNAGQANYSAAKGGVIALTKTTAKEFAARGVRCNAVAPGFIETAMTDKLSDKIKDTMKNLIPLGAFGQPEDIAKVVNFLASDDASYITGEVIKVDGGLVM
ncbi:MAG: 3-oxoacyl-[acyl-carrier-protein] reductase [Planctomycetota bacterium]|jgi:3-oxoacyl-[acyl-carrier protein] reductase|nr:3-oxoacyl-[acyl-carrier-protein] reductase [Planctomycetota bacterium]